MLDSLVRARDTFLKPTTGIMMPSHATMLVAPIFDEEERRAQHNEYAAAMEDWKEFAQTTQNVYGVDMSVLENDFDREQKEYYVLSSRWAELGTGCLLASPSVVKELDMHVCTVEDARGVGLAVGQDEGSGVPFDFDIEGRRHEDGHGMAGSSISGFAGWFTVDFKSRTDDNGRDVAPQVPNPAYLSTGPEMGCELLTQCDSFFVSVMYEMPIILVLPLSIMAPFLTFQLHQINKSQQRYSLGSTSLSPSSCHPCSSRSDHSYSRNDGNDANKSKCPLVQCAI